MRFPPCQNLIRWFKKKTVLFFHRQGIFERTITTSPLPPPSHCRHLRRSTAATTAATLLPLLQQPPPLQLPIIMDGEVAARAVLGNRDVYLSGELFFRLLQDRGQTMSDEDKAKFERKRTKAAVRKKVYFEGMLYPSLYKLAEELYKKISGHEELFPRLLPRQTNPPSPFPPSLVLSLVPSLVPSLPPLFLPLFPPLFPPSFLPMFP